MKEWADYTLTEEERGAFERDGCFMIRNALPPEDLARVVGVVDRLDAENSAQENTESRGRLNLHDLIGKHDVFMDLMDWPRTKSNMDLDHLYDQVDPIRKQLIGYATNGNGRFAPLEEDVPLKAWIEEHLGEKAVMA